MRAQGRMGEDREGPMGEEVRADREWDLLRTVMDGARNVGLAYLDRDLRFLHVNESLARTSGYRREDMIGRNLLELYPGAEHEATFIRVRDTGEPAEHRDMMFPYPDRSLRSATYWDWALSPVKDSKGKVIGLVLTLTETTGKKRAEEVVRRSEEMYRLLHDTMHQGVVFQDAEGNIISMNPVADRILGKDPDDFIGSSSVGEERYCITEDGFPFPGEEHPAMIALRTGEPVEDVIMGVWNLREAAYRWIEVTAVPLFRPGEMRPYSVYTIFEDITEHKKAEDALRMSEERYHRLFDSMAEAFELMELVYEDGKPIDYIFLDVNPAWERMTGLRKEAVVGRRASEAVGFVERYWPEAMDRALRTGESVQMENYGAALNKHYSVSMWKHSEGVCGVTITDITERKESEERVRHNQAILRGINYIFREGIAAASNRELGLACLSVVERLTDSRFGFIGHLRSDQNPEEGGTCSEWEAYSITTPHQDSRFLANLHLHGVFGDVLSKGKSFYTNEPSSHPDYISLPPGHPGLTTFLGAPLMRGGRVIGMIGLGNKSGGYTDDDLRTVESLTPAIVEALHRKRTEEAMSRSAEELRRSNAELQQFAYVASHDLREPLRMVSSYVDLLERNYQGRVLDDTAREYMRFASDGARRMKLMIDDLLRYSRIETRGRAMERVDMNVVLASVLKDLDRAIKESGATVTSDPLPTVTADPTQMAQVIQNLIGNAVKFHGEREPEVHVSSHCKGGEQVFMVKDNGIGIEVRHGDRLFLMFQRLHSQAEYEGTGIGLAIVKKIIDRHHGRLWFESTPGQGSTFFFTIPEQFEPMDLP